MNALIHDSQGRPLVSTANTAHPYRLTSHDELTAIEDEENP